MSKPSFYDFELEILKSMSWVSLKSFYINVLNKFDWIIGTWKRHLPAFGGLLFVKLEMSPCRIVGYDVQGIDLETHLVPMFETNIEIIDCDVSKSHTYLANENISCILYSLKEHNLAIDYDSERPEEIKISCLVGDSDQHHDKEKMKSDFHEAVGMNNVAIPDAIFAGFDNGGITFSEINVPPVSHDVRIIVKPGFFAGDYSAHGNEIVLLQYNSNIILLEKISGDRNVRYGAISLEIDMNFPVDYMEVLKYIARQPDEFSVKRVIEQFPMSEDHWSEKGDKPKSNYVDKSLLQALQYWLPYRTFGIDESDNSFIAALKGKITLGMMPDAEVPDYFYYEILAVITDDNSLCVLCPDEESGVGLDNIDEMFFKRLFS